MPDYDPKNIPVLDDVIDSADNEKRDFDLSPGSAEPHDAGSDTGSYSTENNPDLFASETINLAAEGSDIETSNIDIEAATITDSIIEYTINPAAEPQIGVIDNIANEDSYGLPLYNPEKAAEDGTEKIESALIDYVAVDEAETSTFDMPATTKQEEDQALEVKQQTSTTISLQSVTDDIVKQLMPELEQQLRLLLTQALKEKLPEETSRGDVSPSSDIDSL